MNIASDGAFTMLLGKRAEHIIAEAYLAPGHDFSYEHVVFAEINDKTVGAVSGYTSAQHAESSDKPLLTAAGISALRMVVMYFVGRNLKEFVDSVPEGDHYIHAAAVEESRRGLGIGGRLLDHQEERAKASGSRRVVLDVSEDNEAAKRFYERRGMVVEGQSKPIMWTPGSTVFRMVKDL